MSVDFSKQKKEDLIVKMQGTKEYPRLKNLREKLLRIDTAGELAEILDVTRQTMSKLEKCVNKLSGAQYLAICALIEEKKNIALQILENQSNDNVNKDMINKAIEYLLEIEDFYDAEFAFGVYRLSQNVVEETVIDKSKIDFLRIKTCLDNWKSCIKYKENIANDEMNELIKKSDVIIFITPDDIDIANKFLNKYKEIKEPKGSICLEFNNIIRILEYITESIEDEEPNIVAMDFVYNLSLLKMDGKILLFNGITGTVPDSLFLKSLFLIQNDYFAKMAIEGTMLVKNEISSIENTLSKAFAIYLEKCDFLKYENGNFKRRYFNSFEIENNSLLKVEKIKELESFKKIETLKKTTNKNYGPEKYLEALSNLFRNESTMELEKDMNVELDMLLQKCLEHFRPKNNV